MKPLICISLVLAFYSSILKSDDLITGTWISDQRSKGGLGSTKTYDNEGKVTATYGIQEENNIRS